MTRYVTNIKISSMGIIILIIINVLNLKRVTIEKFLFHH